MCSAIHTFTCSGTKHVHYFWLLLYHHDAIVDDLVQSTQDADHFIQLTQQLSQLHILRFYPSTLSSTTSPSALVTPSLNETTRPHQQFRNTLASDLLLKLVSQLSIRDPALQ